MSTKVLDNLSYEDLLKALENSPQPTSEIKSLPQDTPPVLEFIDRFELKSGEHRVESKLLWNLYLQYYPATITRNVFTEHANKVLSYNHAFFLLNKTSQELYSYLVKKPKKRAAKKAHAPKADLVSFIHSTKVSVGEHKIPWFAFFHLYRCYAIDNGIKKPASKQAFLLYVKMFFKTLPSNDGSLFLVDKDTAHLIPKEDYERLKRLYQKENYTKR